MCLSFIEAFQIVCVEGAKFFLITNPNFIKKDQRY